MTAPKLTSFAAPQGGAQGLSGGRAGPAEMYVLRLADTCLIWSHRLSEWCGHAPVLEEDIALANTALDLLGQARALLSHVGDEDRLAYLREEREFLNVTLAELPNDDFAFTTLRNFVLSSWVLLMWQRLATSSDEQLAAIAGKAAKEARYHREHAADWVVRLGDGTDESARRMASALGRLWPYCAELFDADDTDRDAQARGVGPSWSALEEAWRADVSAVLQEAGMALPADSAFRSDGKRGRHSEHMGRLLAEMQYLHRAFPGGVW
jgi:ring-1,2-phenylacetyl-CoA epoxidase subunit PaaC